MQYINPIIPGFNPDPSICRAGDYFYLVTSTFEYFPGLPIYRSADLVNWELIANALNRDSQLPLQKTKSSDGLFAPTMRHHDGTFYLTCNLVGNGGNFIVTAKDPAGPWSEPVWMNDFGIDGSLFFDDDGKIYYSRAGIDGQNGVMQAELDPGTFLPKTEFRNIWQYPGEWNEGPHLYKIRGKYYILEATGGTEIRHQEVAARGMSPWGPFEPCPHNPVLTHRDLPESPIQCTGHADLVEAQDNSWWAVFLGVRHHNGVSALGRETFLAPVNWTEDGWPVIGENHHAAIQMNAPSFAKKTVVQTAIKQEFNIPALGPEWMHVRNPVREHYSLTARPGYLRLTGSAASMEDIAQQTFAGIRQRHFRMKARCSMEFLPVSDNEEAGFCLRANDENHYQVSMGRQKGKNIVFFRSVLKSKITVMAVTAHKGPKVFFEILGNESQYVFSWSADGKKWNKIAQAAAADVAPENINGFTGAVIGMYSTGNGRQCVSPADFERFEYVSEG